MIERKDGKLGNGKREDEEKKLKKKERVDVMKIEKGNGSLKK